MKSVGIDIGTSSIKVVEMQSTTKGFQVVQYFDYPLNTNPGQDQELQVIEHLRDIASKYDHAQTHFVFALQQDRVSIRNKFFPFNDRLKIAKSLSFELEEDLPFSADNAIYDAKIIRIIGPGAEVLACASPKIHVQNALQRAQDGGFEPHLLSSEGTAFANPFERWNEAPPAIQSPGNLLDENVRPIRYINLVLNIGHTRTLVSAFEGSSLVAVRSILWGGKNVAEAIAAKYEIPYHEALNEMQTKAFILTNKQGATFDQVTFSETIAKSVREMSRDLQLSILEVKSEFNAQITSIGMTGGASQIQNLGAFLTQVLENPVNVINVLDHVPNVLFDRSQKTSAKIGVALGLAIEGFKKPRNPPINFMRGDFAKQNNRIKKLWERWGYTVQIATAALVVLFTYASLRDSIAEGLADRSQEALKNQAKTVAKLSPKNATESGIKKYILQYKKRAADLKTLSSVATMNSAMDVMKKISDALPQKGQITLDVHELNINDAQVNISGYVASPREMTLLQSSLTNVTADGQVHAGRAILPALAGKTAFAFSFNVDRGVQKVSR
jgi:general secretion pathway protein L